MVKSSDSKLEANYWETLHVFDNKVRVEIVKLLLQFEWRSLSEISKKLEKRGWKMTLPGLLKHMKELEKAGIVRRESGIYAEKPDARKTIYMLEGKERVEKIMKHLEENVGNPLRAGVIFSKTAELARNIQRSPRLAKEEGKKRLESLLAQCESKKVYPYLTEDEKKKVKLWKMMLEIL